MSATVESCDISQYLFYFLARDIDTPQSAFSQHTPRLTVTLRCMVEGPRREPSERRGGFPALYVSVSLATCGGLCPFGAKAWAALWRLGHLGDAEIEKFEILRFARLRRDRAAWAVARERAAESGEAPRRASEMIILRARALTCLTALLDRDHTRDPRAMPTSVRHSRP